MLLNNRSVPNVTLTRSHLAHGFKFGGRQIGGRWYETPPAGGDPPAAGEMKHEAKPDDVLGDAGKAALQKERDAREAAEKEAKRLKKLVDDAEAATARAAEEDAVKRGEFEKIAKDRQTRIEELEAEVAKRDRLSLRDKVAAKHGLVGEHAELADFITGDTEDEMTVKAKVLAARVLPKKAADTEGGKRTGPTNGKPAVTTNGGNGSAATTNYSWMPAGAVTIPD